MIKKNYPSVKLICNKKNLGYSKSYNIGSKAAKGKYVLHLNSDIIFMTKISLKAALEYLEKNKKVGILGAKIVKPDGQLDLPCKRSFPTLINVFFQTFGLTFLFPKSKLFGQYYLTYIDENRITEVDCLMGAFMLIRKNVFKKIGYLDESFFIYGEDIDFCYRTKKTGWQIVYFPKIIIKHHHGATINKTQIKNLIRFHEAMILYYKKHFANKNNLVINFLVYIATFIRFFIYLILNKLH